MERNRNEEELLEEARIICEELKSISVCQVKRYLHVDYKKAIELVDKIRELQVVAIY